MRGSSGRLSGRVSRTTRSSFDFATSLGPLELSVTFFVTTVERRDTRRSSAGRRSAMRELPVEVLERESDYEKKGKGRSD